MHPLITNSVLSITVLRGEINQTPFIFTKTLFGFMMIRLLFWGGFFYLAHAVIIQDPSVVRNYGDLVIELAHTVPDGMVCFFTSYSYMEDVVMQWNKTGVLQKVR